VRPRDRLVDMLITIAGGVLRARSEVAGTPIVAATV
jgi:hypothetical protein